MLGNAGMLWLAGGLSIISACQGGRGQSPSGDSARDTQEHDSESADTGDAFEPSREGEELSLSAASVEVSNLTPSGRIWGAAFADDLDGDASDDILAWGFDDANGQAVYILGAGVPKFASPNDGLTIAVAESYDHGWMHRPSGTHDLTGDGLPDLVVSPGDAFGGVMVAAGPLSGDAATFPMDAWFAGTTADGPQVFATGDHDGDGIGDLIVAVHAFEEGSYNGLVVLSGPIEGANESDDADGRRSSVLELLSGGFLAAGADLDGDGYQDAAFASSNFTELPNSHGAAWVFRGPMVGDGTFEDAEAILVGTSDGDPVGGPLALSEGVDGGAAGSILLGSKYFRRFGGWGAGLLVDGSTSGTVEIEAYGRIVGEERCAFTGTSVVFGDVDGDSLSDAVVGSPGQEGGDCFGDSLVGIVSAPSRGNWWLSEVDAFISVEETAFATTLDSGRDMDGDGKDDILVGNTYRAWLFLDI